MGRKFEPCRAAPFCGPGESTIPRKIHNMQLADGAPPLNSVKSTQAPTKVFHGRNLAKTALIDCRSPFVLLSLCSLYKYGKKMHSLKKGSTR